MTKSVDYRNIDKENPVINSEFGINNWGDIKDFPIIYSTL